MVGLATVLMTTKTIARLEVPVRVAPEPGMTTTTASDAPIALHVRSALMMTVTRIVLCHELPNPAVASLLKKSIHSPALHTNRKPPELSEPPPKSQASNRAFTR